VSRRARRYVFLARVIAGVTELYEAQLFTRITHLSAELRCPLQFSSDEMNGVRTQLKPRSYRTNCTELDTVRVSTGIFAFHSQSKMKKNAFVFYFHRKQMHEIWT